MILLLRLDNILWLVHWLNVKFNLALSMLNASFDSLFHWGHKVEGFICVLANCLNCALFKVTLAKAIIHIVTTLISLVYMILLTPLAGALTFLQWVLAQGFEPGHLVQ